MAYLRCAAADADAGLLPLLQDAGLVDQVYDGRQPVKREEPDVALDGVAVSQPRRLTQNALMGRVEAALNDVTDKERSVRLKAG